VKVLRVAIVLAMVSGVGILVVVALAVGSESSTGDVGGPPVQSAETLSRELASWRGKDVHAFWLGASPAGRRLSRADRGREDSFTVITGLDYGDCIETDPGSGCNWEVAISTVHRPLQDPFVAFRSRGFIRERNVAGRRFGVMDGGYMAVMQVKGFEVIISAREAPVDHWLRFVRPLR
jgi:hypothetical protein